MLDTVTPGRAAAELVKGIKVIDVDTHLSEPHDLWTSRAPAKMGAISDSARAVGCDDQLPFAWMPPKPQQR